MDSEVEQFHEALERAPGERAAFVEAKYAGDPRRVRRLLDLLEAHERGERASADARAASAAPCPERIGQYAVLELVGEGGMGLVYAAEQREPLRRRVAIKVIKLGMDTREVLARFEAERQALALMDHPGVAKALDAGITEEGRPYFVMELVKGLPLTTYCSKHKLVLRERLQLFVEVCSAVQHAHQKGIIHRDLKPSNILVADQDGRPVPKVIDFGIAKATAARLTERTLFTEQGRLIGTPEYMSPEQAEMSGLDVDTRTDVYSLGVLLYELLSGVLPFDPKALRGGGYGDILRVVREVDPARPSTRLRELSRAEPEHRRDLSARARSVRGELDWIVMRAMEKDRARRYRTANALGEDVLRFLADRPVEAGPPSAAYNVRKFVKRHRFGTALVALTLLSVVTGLVGLTAGLIRAREAEALATRRADNAQAAARFLERVLFQADPEFGGRATSLLDLMDSAGRLIGEDLGPYPEMEAQVRESLGVAYRRRSLFVEGRPHLERSLELRRADLGEGSLETAHGYVALADLDFEQRGSIADALDKLDRARAIFEAHGLLGTAAEGWLQLDVGMIALAGDQLGLAERALVRCRELLARHRGPDHPDVSRPVRELAHVALAGGRVDEAELLAREAVALCEGAGDDYIGGRAQLQLASVLIAQGRLDDASEQLDRSGSRFFDTVGCQHIRIAERQAVLGALHLAGGELGAAEVITERCVEMRRAMLDEGHWSILEARLLLRRARMGLGELESAEAELEELAQGARRTLGADHRLALEIARARLECAAASGDEVLERARAQELEVLIGRRAERLRSEGA